MLSFLLSALAFLVLLTVLILIHEWGHYFAALKSGVAVEEFGIGLPPRAKTLFRWEDTLFTLNWIPFGGFVRLRGENAVTTAERRAPGSFASAPLLSRVVILSAGVIMNFLLAFVLLTFGFSVWRWIPSYFSFAEMQHASEQGIIHLKLAVMIDGVVDDQSAAQAKVPAKSILTAVDGKPVTLPEDVGLLQEGKNRVTYSVLTGQDFSIEREYSLTLRDGKAGVELVAYPLELSAPARSLLAGAGLALREVKVVTEQTVIGIGQLFKSLFTTGTIPEGIMGIVGIARLTHASVQVGLLMYLRLVALLSLSLGILNVLPFPALDGGRLLFVFIEFLFRRPLNRRFEATTNMIGFFVLILLIVLITFNDVLRLFV
ncbi:TPA: hypothetical protein DCL30_05125 [Candidatus Peribacteria bacterium]|nr:MAG: hypothetical protein A2529_01045 [Candidatus Peribacteria bacterium RIFOXYD2_FULL_58_15]HAI98880.1 hypothetical protein [Candidatus Peribacteria bacterium]HAS33722.1 hypothetical protein [Candidatus Peribacteria bacterium]